MSFEPLFRSSSPSPEYTVQICSAMEIQYMPLADFTKRFPNTKPTVGLKYYNGSQHCIIRNIDPPKIQPRAPASSTRKSEIQEYLEHKKETARPPTKFDNARLKSPVEIFPAEIPSGQLFPTNPIRMSNDWEKNATTTLNRNNPSYEENPNKINSELFKGGRVRAPARPNLDYAGGCDAKTGGRQGNASRKYGGVGEEYTDNVRDVSNSADSGDHEKWFGGNDTEGGANYGRQITLPDGRSEYSSNPEDLQYANNEYSGGGFSDW